MAAVMWIVAAEFTDAQQPLRTVADGIYTDGQATRGAASYEAACARCHRSDLGGADGPALKEDRFGRVFAGKPLKGLYERITATMPRPAPGSLAEGVYLDILAHLLRENGFPAGARELIADALDGVELLPTRPRTLPPMGDFSYVEVAGCLARGSDGGWQLERATAPVTVSPSVPGLARPPDVAATVTGDQTIHLIDAMAYDPDRHVGYILSVRGTLIRQGGQQRLTISTIQPRATLCR
jgi:hypothetical protein